MHHRRVAITGCSIISSLGASLSDVAQSILDDRCTFSRSTVDPELVVSPVTDFDLRAVVGPLKERRYLHRGAQLALAAAVRAAYDADLDAARLAGASLFVASGPNLNFGEEFPSITNGHFDRPDLSPLFLLRFLPNTAAATIARVLGIHGENLSIGNACAASTQALGEAFRRIRCGYATVSLAVGGDCRLHAGGLLAYKKANALCVGASDPSTAMRPFDAERSGFVPGEGAAALVLEDMQCAKERNARILGEILGYGSSMDGGSLTDPEGDGRAAQLAVRSALSEARLDATDIQLVAAHGTSTIKNDAREAELLSTLFPHRPKVIALKSWVGHLASACGVVELALLLSTLEKGFLPPVRSLRTPCHDSLDFVRSLDQGTFSALTLLESFGFGGQNAALALRLGNVDA